MTINQNSEYETVQSILNGETEKFRWVMDRYAPIVFHIVRRFESDEAMVKERAHEIFLKVYERLDSFQGRSALSSWIYQLALNDCRDKARQDKRRSRYTDNYDEDDAERIQTESGNPESELISSEMNDLLNVCIDHLEKDYAVPLVMKYQQGLSYPQISELLGVSVSALKVRVHRARKDLKNMMERKL